MDQSVSTMERLGRFPWRPVGWSLAGLLLILPLIAMRFTDEVNWTGRDFLAAALMLGGTGLAMELTLTRFKDLRYALAWVLVLSSALLLLWINLAVGILGAEDHPANAWFLAIFAMGLLGALASRLRPVGMARTMLAVAATQFVLLAIGIAAVPGDVLKTVILNGLFIAAWLISAALFFRAARPTTAE
ncbi:hypothetical protein [Wenzhouxiangella marina]|uniref:Uncharacterized protein n=1 Tax=Wenzhouxiangella marina TaxID=1579979 RepID=A0A0K0XZF9_9GAMM|nr:hypothetical protein [Wenzhouxiangella marina]AKS43006.1 hypothetical protein WM2015_2648 [Wenzhouxiangella marina]MBB6087311.1 hypothetical protein [Wenzhouxiangella marina]